MIERLEINGKLYIGGDWYVLCIDDPSHYSNHIADIVSDFFEDNTFSKVKLQYFISDSPIDPDKAEENFLRTFYEGDGSASGNPCYGSSWTGMYSLDDDFTIGGHDITSELKEHEGKYCYMILEAVD